MLILIQRNTMFTKELLAYLTFFSVKIGHLSGGESQTAK